MSFLGRLAKLGNERRLREQYYGPAYSYDDGGRRKRFAAEIQKITRDWIRAGKVDKATALMVFADEVESAKWVQEQQIARNNELVPRVTRIG